MSGNDYITSPGFHEKSHKLYDIIYKNRDIATIIDEASIVFDNSLILSDNSYNVLACTSFVDSYNLTYEDELWTFISGNGYYPPDYIDYVINTGKSGDFMTSFPGITKDDGYHCRYYSRRIYVDDKNVGFVTLVEHKKPISEEDTYLLNELTHVLKVALERNKMKKESSDEKYTYVISELLSSKPDPGRLRNRLAFSGLKLLPYLNVVIIRKMSVDRDLSVEYLLKKTEGFVAGGKGVVFDEDSVAFIAMREKLEDDCITDREAALDYFRKRNITVGISYTFKNIGNTSLHVHEAEEAIDVGRHLHPGDLIYDYEKYCVFAAINKNMSADESMALVNPRIGMVREYDRMHGTDYYETLKAYIESDLNMNATAKRMNLHRNTIDYRITKLRDSFGITPENGALSLGYRLSFFLFETMK